MEQIRQYFKQFVTLSDEEWDDFSKGFRKQEVKKKDYLLEEGKVCDFIAFVREGAFRFYHVKDGNEKVTAFFFPGDVVSNYRSFLSNEPSNHYIEAMEDAVVFTLKKEHLQKMYNTYPNMDRLGRLVAENLYLMVASRLDSFLHDSPEERYAKMLNRNSELIQKIPQYMMASYLGVSAESLSRIRKRMTKK